MNRKQLIAILESPATIILFISLTLFTINMFFTYRLRPFNSDDVFWQAILLHWHPFDGTLSTLGNSSIYVDKIPFYEFFNYFFEPSRKILFAQAAINALLGFTGFYLASLYFLKKADAKLSFMNLLPFVWLSSFGYSFAQLYLNTNWRGFQLGVSFVVFALAAAVWYGDIKLRTWLPKIALVALSAYAGLQMYSDPYFLYFTIVPLALLSLLLFVFRKINLRQFLTVGLPILASLIFTKVFGIIYVVAGIRTTIDYPMEFVHFENLADGFNGSIHSIIILFGADFFGLELKHLLTFTALLNFVLLVVIVYIIGSLLRGLRQENWRKVAFDKIWQLFFTGVCCLVFMTHSISTLGQGTFTYRYFLIVSLLFTLLFAFALSAMKNVTVKYVLASLLIGATLLNLTLTTLGNQDSLRADVANNKANSLNHAVIGILKNKGYSKGYANYWDANISTYLSGGKISFLPSVCNNQQAQKWYWLINNSAFDATSLKSFYFFNPDVPAACQATDIAQQFGKAKETIPIGNKLIFLYDYDITSRLETAK